MFYLQKISTFREGNGREEGEREVKGREGNLVRRKREDRKINKGGKTRQRKKESTQQRKKSNFLRMA